MRRIFFEEITKYSRFGLKKFRRVRKKTEKRLEPFVTSDIGSFLFGNLIPAENVKTRVWSILFFTLLVFGVFFLFLGRTVVLQLWSGSDYLDLAFANKTRFFTIQAERGVIYDRNDTVLVRNKPAFGIVMDTSGCLLEGNVYLCESIIDTVASFVDLDKERAYKDLLLRRPNVVLADGLTKEDVVTFETRLRELPNVDVVTSPVRDYLYGEIFAHLIGYLGFGETLYPSVEGKAGVEEFYNDVLAGYVGRKVLQTDSLGSRFSSVSVQEPVPGKNIALYVDLKLQEIAYEEIKKKVADGDALAGAVVAQDPKTGGILALVSYPAFDPDKLSSGISSQDWDTLNKKSNFPFFNRVISAVYPPGSTFKVVPATAALAEGVVGAYYEIFDPGYIQVGSYIFRNWKTDGHGPVDLRRALQVSNDTYFYTVGGGYGGVSGLGIEKLSLWAKRFGFGSKTGVDLGGEVAGFVPDGNYKDWYLGDTYITSIGQGDLLTTPLQINNMLTYFANGGYLLQPKVVKSIEGAGESNVEVLAQGLVDEYIYETVREGLNMAVESGGTGYPLFDFPQKYGIKLAGKTGTSEYMDKDGEAKTHAWFAVFGPYEDANIVLTVFLEGGGSGSDDAAPIARTLLDYWFGGK